jgi:hypothetical protein
MNIVFHPKSHTCAQYGAIWINYHMVLVMTQLIYLESHGTMYMEACLWEDFSRVFAIVQVCYFFLQIVHITWKNVKVSYFLNFLISYAQFKMRSKQQAWPFLARGWVLENYHWIYDEIYTCEAQNDFLKKSWTYYEAPIVQIWPISNRFGRSLSFLWQTHGKLWTLK